MCALKCFHPAALLKGYQALMGSLSMQMSKGSLGSYICQGNIVHLLFQGLGGCPSPLLRSWTL